MGRMVHRANLYGLANPSDWKRLGDVPVLMQVDVWSNPGNAIYRLPISKRRAWMNRRISRLRDTLIEEVNLDVIRRGSPASNPRALKVRIPARRVPLLSRRPEVNWLRLLSIPGRRPRSVVEKRTFEWYSVRARFAIVVEGRSAEQKSEDRVLLVKATDFRNAERRARREFKQYESTYLGTKLRKVRWRLAGIEGIFHTFIDRFDPAGTEVWSSIGRRRR